MSDDNIASFADRFEKRRRLKKLVDKVPTHQDLLFTFLFHFAGKLGFTPDVIGSVEDLGERLKLNHELGGHQYDSKIHPAIVPFAKRYLEEQLALKTGYMESNFEPGNYEFGNRAACVAKDVARLWDCYSLPEDKRVPMIDIIEHIDTYAESALKEASIELFDKNVFASPSPHR